ncbi:hypothetical protein ACFVT5_21415 [Streptomyces sp. NPDC058001]|uniref:hypothetical protein n=1 Tax=Streptomyces sp. NPDC058001 TaxID=3346300 RepID=UPI0036E5A26B
MVAKIEGKYDVNLFMTLSAKLGISVKVKTPPKKTADGKYGAFRVGWYFLEGCCFQ